MARVTRQSSRRTTAASASSQKTTPLSNVSPVVSSRPESVVETPATSEAEDIPLSKARSVSARGKMSGARKRAADSEDDLEDISESNSRARAPKRRAVSSTVFVSLPSLPNGKGMKKVESSRGTTLAPIPQKGLQAVTTQSAKSKGKAKAIAVSPPSSEDEADSASKTLEYNEEPQEIEESDDSGSEFQVSDEEYMDEEDEEIMLDAAVRESLQTVEPNGAGSSSSNSINGPSAAARLRAAAAERRLARKNKTIDVDDYEEAQSSGCELNAFSSSDEEPLINSFRSKGQGEAMSQTTSPPKIMTVADLKRARREARQASRMGRNANKKEERALMKKLGRKLTHVSNLFGCHEN